MNHMEFVKSESQALEPTSFEKWAALVEREYGIVNLDGDQASDGYSIDGAFEAFERGWSVEDYISTLPA